jgi:hypothetical protein
MGVPVSPILYLAGIAFHAFVRNAEVDFPKWHSSAIIKSHTSPHNSFCRFARLSQLMMQTSDSSRPGISLRAPQTAIRNGLTSHLINSFRQFSFTLAGHITNTRRISSSIAFMTPIA